MKKISSLTEISELDISQDLVSFDIFDTLLFRRYLQVNEVHDLASAYALSLLGQFGKENPGTMTLTRYDITNIMKTAPGERVEEPSLEAVWCRLFAARIGASDKALSLGRKVAAFEYEIDSQNLYAVNGAAQMLAALKARGKTIIAISDMYFSQDEIEGLLLRTGLAPCIERVFVSSQENLTKHSGNLFTHVWNTLEVLPEQTLHFGDNTHSDVAMPVSLGGSAVHVAHAPLLKIDRPEYGKRPDIHEEIGDLSKLFLAQLMLSAQSNRSDQIFFLSRDGCLLREVLTKWASPLFRDFFTPVVTDDLFLSRAVTCWLNVNFQDRWLLQSIGHAFWLHHGKASARQISAMLGISAVPEALALDPDHVYQSSTDTFTVLDAYEESDELVESIRTALLQKRAEAAAYLRDAGFFDHRSISVCDVGYSGTVVRDLNTFFLQEGAGQPGNSVPTVHFHCISSNANYAGNARAALPCVLFQKDVILSENILPTELKESFAWLEMFFKHPTRGPLLGYKKEHGKTVPSYEVATTEDPDHPAHRILSTVTDHPSDIVLLWMGAIGFWSQFTSPLLDRFMNPDEATIGQMLSDVYEIDAVSGETRSVVLVAADLPDEDIRRRARDEDYWIPGSLIASRLARRKYAARSDSKRKTLQDKLHAIIADHPDHQRDTLRDTFDPVFYRRFYRDLNALPNNRALEDHYLTHGRLVGRFASEAAMRAALKALTDQLPRDFDAGAYCMANPDLHIGEPVVWNAVRHYLAVGRQQKRPYIRTIPEIDESFEALVLSGKIRLTEEEQHDHRAGVPARIILLRRTGTITAPWLAMLDFQEFSALNFEWCGTPETIAEAVLAFLNDGIARIAPLSLSVSFDPDFYRRQYPDTADLPDTDAYRQWLESGCLTQRDPSEERALERMTGLRTYPSAFRWDELKATDPTRFAQSTRLDLLRVFLTSATLSWRSMAEGPGSGDLWALRAAKAREAGDSGFELEALREATRAEPERGIFWHSLGDRLKDRGQLHEALEAYASGLKTETPNRWSYINCIYISAELGFFESGLRYLRAAGKIWKEMQPWRAARSVLFMRWFDHAAHHCYDPLGPDDIRAVQHPDMRFLTFLNDFVVAVGSVGMPEPLSLARSNGPILILCGAGISERTRWEASLRLPQNDERRVLVFSREQALLFAESLPGASVALYHEVETDAVIIDTILRARAYGVRTVFWAGPPGRSDDADGPDLSDLAWSNFVLSRDSRDVGRTLRSVHAATMCDEVILTTPSLVSRFRELDIRPHLGASALMTALADLRSDAASAHDAQGPLRIFCSVSGRPLRASSGNRNAFAPRAGQQELISALGLLMADHPDVCLLLEGANHNLIVPADVRARIECLTEPLTSDQRLAALSRSDIALDLSHTLRDQRSLADEAAWSGVASLILADKPVKPVGKQPCCLSWTAVTEVLEQWLSNPGKRQAAAARARSAINASLHTTPLRWTPVRAIPDQKTKPRILFANLFAPPQTTGGATRVLSDNIRYMLDHAGDSYDFAILASDDENSDRGATRADSWNGIPVFRIATPQELDMDWRAYNSQVDAFARRVLGLFKPDLVHIHCLPRLSVAVAEACRSHGVPYVITLHDAWWVSDFPFLVQEDGKPADVAADASMQPFSQRIGLPRSLERAARLRMALRHAQELLSVSEEFAAIYRKAGFRVSTIANGVSPLPASLRTPREGRVRLGHLGGLEYHKGAYLIEAALRSRNFLNLSLTILEHARDPGSPIETHWGNTPVTIRGKVPAEKITVLYDDMDVLLAPSTWPESFGLVSREAAECGVWVVAGNQGAMASDVTEGVNGFIIDTTSPADLVRVLELIDSTPERFLNSPPPPAPPLRQADDQARDLLCLYEQILAHHP